MLSLGCRFCFSLALAVFVITGCALETAASRSNYILVHKEGYPINLERDGLTESQFKEQYINEILAGIDKYAEAQWDQRPEQAARLLIHVHGGLNTYRAGLEKLDALLSAQKDPGRYPQLASSYILSINWNSSLFSSLWDDLFIIRRGERDPLGGTFTSPFVFTEHLAESFVRIPKVLWYQGENAVDSFRPDAINKEPWIDTALAGGWYFIMYPVRMISLPFIQGYGRPAWDMMKRRNNLVLAHHGTLRHNGYTKEGAGHLLFDAIQHRASKPHQWTTANGRSGPLEVWLVGHSMGAMVLSRVLQSFQNLYVSRIIYMAAACSLEEFDTDVVVYLNSHPQTRFWSFVLSDLDEARESGPADIWERGSLLVWIDHLYEPVLTPMHRRLGRYRNYKEHYELSEDLVRSKQVCMVQFPGQSPYPREHGEFSDPEQYERMLGMVQQDAEACLKTQNDWS